MAWRRTCLALAVGNAVAIRYLFEALGPGARDDRHRWPGVVGRRLATVQCAYRRTHARFVADDEVIPDGRLSLLLVATIGVVIIAAIAVVVTLWAPWASH